MSLSRTQLAAELDRLAIRATDRNDGLVDFGDADPAVFLFEVARVLREDDETIRAIPGWEASRRKDAWAESDASAARRRADDAKARAEEEAEETARRDTRKFLSTPEARAVLDGGKIRSGLVYRGKVLKGDNTDGLSLSVLLPMAASPEFPLGARVQLVKLQ